MPYSLTCELLGCRQVCRGWRQYV